MDEYISEHFRTLLEQAEHGDYTHWESEPRSCLALILLLDQFSRHLYRDSKERRDGNDKKALAIAQGFLKHEEKWRESLSVAELCFLLLPLRHSRQVNHLQSVMDEIRLREENMKNDTALLAKFRKVSLRSLQGESDNVVNVNAHSSGLI